MRILSSPYSHYINPPAPRAPQVNTPAPAPNAPARPAAGDSLSEILTDEERSFFAAETPGSLWYGQNGATQSSLPAPSGGLVDVRG